VVDFAGDRIECVPIDNALRRRIAGCTEIIRVGTILDILTPFRIKELHAILERRA
jgi:hypothetical protein